MAYTILAYKDVEQVERLIRMIYRPSNVVCVHLDLKTDPKIVQNVSACITIS